MKVLVVNDRKNVVGELITALNSVDIPDGCEVAVTALNFQLANDGGAPEMIELIQPGKILVGRDGREFLNDDPHGVVAALNALGADLVIDFNHASELKAPTGDSSPAAGWANKFEVREGGAIWGQASWTPEGEKAVVNREYRYLSPALIYSKKTKQIRALSSIALVNQPNLFNKALNHQQKQKEDQTMLKDLLAKLGLPEDATLQQALNAIGKMETDLETALNRAGSPDLAKFVPRADYDSQVDKANNAVQALATREKEDLDSEVESAITAALQAGKITPATKDFYVTSCNQQGGLEKFKEFVAAAPVVGDPATFDESTLEEGKALNAEQQAIATAFGNTAEDIAKYGQA